MPFMRLYHDSTQIKKGAALLGVSLSNISVAGSYKSKGRPVLSGDTRQEMKYVILVEIEAKRPLLEAQMPELNPVGRSRFIWRSSLFHGNFISRR
jgi:hypothetical protein